MNPHGPEGSESIRVEESSMISTRINIPTIFVFGQTFYAAGVLILTEVGFGLSSGSVFVGVPVRGECKLHKCMDTCTPGTVYFTLP